MKTTFLCLALLLTGAAGFAQKTFDRATFDALMNRYAQDPVKFLKTEITNLNIQQAGNLAVATGISSTTALPLDGSQTNVYKDAFTYTLRCIGGNWLFTNLHHTKIDYK
jgi:ketosteroid isomerase-like protein